MSIERSINHKGLVNEMILFAIDKVIQITSQIFHHLHFSDSISKHRIHETKNR